MMDFILLDRIQKGENQGKNVFMGVFLGSRIKKKARAEGKKCHTKMSDWNEDVYCCLLLIEKTRAKDRTYI